MVLSDQPLSLSTVYKAYPCCSTYVACSTLESWVMPRWIWCVYLKSVGGQLGHSFLLTLLSSAVTDVCLCRCFLYVFFTSLGHVSRAGVILLAGLWGADCSPSSTFHCCRGMWSTSGPASHRTCYRVAFCVPPSSWAQRGFLQQFCLFVSLTADMQSHFSVFAAYSCVLSEKSLRGSLNWSSNCFPKL